ncbi:Fe-S oxidoreductase [Desulfosporosinus orientis DSM 765]|uniref:Fe-S oxidoreductase n=1 Tax=Desulfosporosinus orientis (strain ATCC 19365 / DSM 765 / NCIMB 8382 / VKM B-1628 / Singapore I) TaxID=768706 RepID=G7WGC0_DESOD|nr:B12-binding domain-containing radical SAM protein [Desulfosporosinus orientis]AET70852.1 Fe-S oxidoreductase [Desulfosporosinus orientis DSM 765]
MRILLVALNAKYIHTNLAIRYLREEVSKVYSEVLLREFSINDHLDRVAGEIFEIKADIIGFSCYIWNLKETLALVRQLRPVCPEVRFVIGGPEVSFEAEEFLLDHPEVDALVMGEGEKSFLELLQTWQEGHDPSQVPGLAWRFDGQIIVNPPSPKALSLNDLPFPYGEEEDFTGRLVYVETTRGCPFNCQYCLSSTFQGVRFLDPERFRKMLRCLFKNGARTIKFVDRTFNANKRHAMRILDIVREESVNHPDTQEIRVHCEMAGDLLDGEWMEYFRNYPRGLIQLEIGVQSTHRPTLEIVSRPQNFEKWSQYISEMKAFGIPLHLDLIAGLPEEDWQTFGKSFNEVYTVAPDMLQLGFLKVLRGSGLRLQSMRYGLVFAPDPPYTILATKVLSYSELLQLQRIEDVLDRYYNSGKFKHALGIITTLFSTPFDFYHEFAEFWQQKGWFGRQWQGKALFDKLWEFLRELSEEKLGTDPFSWSRIRDALRFDYYLWERPNYIPDYLQYHGLKGTMDSEVWKTTSEEIRKSSYWESVIPERIGMDRRQWFRNTAVAYFTAELDNDEESKKQGWYLFHYQQGKVKAYRYDEEG